MKEYLLSSVDRRQAFTGGLSTVELTGEEADTFFDALASSTTRELLEALYDEPATASELAERSDTSLQNVHYHLKKLTAADLIKPVDMVYSSRGREVDVYGPTNRALVLVAGESSLVGELKTAMARFVGVVAVLALAALLVQSLVAGGPLLDALSPAGEPVAEGGPASTATPTGDNEVFAGETRGNTSGEGDQVNPSLKGSTATPTSTQAADDPATPTASPTPTPTANETTTGTTTAKPTGHATGPATLTHEPIRLARP